MRNVSDKKKGWSNRGFKVGRGSFSMKNVILSKEKGPLPLTARKCEETGWSVDGHAGRGIEKWFHNHSGVIVSLAGPVA